MRSLAVHVIPSGKAAVAAKGHGGSGEASSPVVSQTLLAAFRKGWRHHIYISVLDKVFDATNEFTFLPERLNGCAATSARISSPFMA